MDIKQDLSTSQKLLAVHGYLRSRFKQYILITSHDIITLIYYFYDTKLQRSYLSSYYYSIVYISRPFGISLCKNLNEQYICLVMPNSPNGKLGLRRGSQVIGYNNFVFKEDDIEILNKYFPDTKLTKFTVQTNIYSYISSNNCFPLILYLKYDPIDLLSKIDDLENDFNCNYLKETSNELYRWAIEGKVEYYKINDNNGLDIYSMLPLQSSIIYENILKTVKTQHKTDDIDINSDNMNIKWNNIISKCVKYDDNYFKVGHLEYNDMIKVYGKAGCYLYVIRPIKGWIKFLNTENGAKNAIKINDIDNNNADNADKDDTIKAPIVDNEKLDFDSIYHFNLMILTKYIRQKDLTKYITNVNILDNEANDFNRNYKIMDIINSIENQISSSCFKIIYFMNTLSFSSWYSSNSNNIQQNHIKKLINISKKNINVELIFITVHGNVTSDFTAKLPIIINGIELYGYIIGRTPHCSLKEFNIESITLFQFGLLFLGKQNQIFIKPNEIINDSTFRKIHYLINGRRLSNMNLDNAPFLIRTLSQD